VKTSVSLSLSICIHFALLGEAFAEPNLIRPMGVHERPIVFHKVKAEHKDQPLVEGPKYEEFVSSKDGLLKFYDQPNWSQLAFFGPLRGKGEHVAGSHRSDYATSDDAEPATNWPLRYVVRLNDSTPDRHTYGDPPQREFRPYAKPVQTDVRRFDREGQELDVLSGKPTGRRVYKLGERYYLGTVSIPRKLLSVFEWQLCTQSQQPRLLPCYRDEPNADGSVKFVRGTQASRHTLDAVNKIVSEGPQSARSISSLKEIWALHDDPVHPLVISDYPLSP
jgi:hypothetical protein